MCLGLRTEEASEKATEELWLLCSRVVLRRGSIKAGRILPALFVGAAGETLQGTPIKQFRKWLEIERRPTQNS